MTTGFASVPLLLPGLAVSGCIGSAAYFLSERFGGPALLLALLLGLAFNAVAERPSTAAGVQFSATTVLRVGVALLGARITVADVASLGPGTIVLVMLGAIVVVLVGFWIGRGTRLPADTAMLSAGAVGICGASAALAIASVLPRRADLEQKAVVTIACVSTLSTVAMMAYPLVASGARLDDREAGIFIGATIHDVAQVVGAAYTISPEAGDIATIVKLLRVACLLPVLVGVGLLFRSGRLNPGLVRVVVPWFLIAFACLVAAGSLGWIEGAVRRSLVDLSGGCLLVAVAALGIRTSFRELSTVGPGVVTAMILQSLFLMAAALIAVTIG
jgi:uncharacterized integral membrane protein (TIGR00698 family)